MQLKTFTLALYLDMLHACKRGQILRMLSKSRKKNRDEKGVARGRDKGRAQSAAN